MLGIGCFQKGGERGIIEAILALYTARNSKTHTTKRGTITKGYADYNKFAGGRVILKIKGQENLIYLNVNDLRRTEGSETDTLPKQQP